MQTSRRRFLTLVTAGTAALIAGATPARPQAKSRARAGARPRAAQTEIDNQKKYVAKSLQAIRGYPLPPGSEMAFAFRPLAPRKKRKGAGR